MKVFFPNYHIAVNQTFVSDVIATGNEIYQPAEDWRGEHISFFASSEPNSKHITYQEWLEMPPMAVVIPCEQHIEDMKRAVAERGNIDTIDNPDGWPQPPLTHELIINSMFTLSPKRRETWGQNVNESMLMGVPVIVFENTLNSTFTEYLLTKDNAIIAKDATDAINQINALTFEQYETLCIQARTMSELYCSAEPRINQLKWFLSKIG